jgi:hypothetical protein
MAGERGLSGAASADACVLTRLPRACAAQVVFVADRKWGDAERDKLYEARVPCARVRALRRAARKQREQR